MLLCTTYIPFSSPISGSLEQGFPFSFRLREFHHSFIVSHIGICYCFMFSSAHRGLRMKLVQASGKLATIQPLGVVYAPNLKIASG